MQSDEPDARPIVTVSTKVGAGAASLECSITDETGRVLVTRHASTGGGANSTADAACYLP